jgi:hypothetical protein
LLFDMASWWQFVADQLLMLRFQWSLQQNFGLGKKLSEFLGKDNQKRGPSTFPIPWISRSGGRRKRSPWTRRFWAGRRGRTHWDSRHRGRARAIPASITICGDERQWRSRYFRIRGPNFYCHVKTRQRLLHPIDLPYRILCLRFFASFRG